MENDMSENLFFEASVPEADRKETRELVEGLPGHSIIGQWAIGITTVMPPWAVRTELICYKGWHDPRYPSLHATFRLNWVDANGNTSTGHFCAIAHLHQDGEESVQEHSTAVIWARGGPNDWWSRRDPPARRGPPVKTVFELHTGPETRK
ncbi:hypothetical protein DM02DRAFT_661505 [Periconia macrospinosa]|uniref:Uncharacterized protein n=1 Tax=Periconia macrospinosa TaxID=97972 RepID=A0A2V1D7B8_9PLEO|nr:hypothetical protein DM02DRAFT_661505 [Periconia macrospinosa]